jgi:hypothetical protein
LRSSSKNPVMIKGKWNQKVYDELLNRLKKHVCYREEGVYWMERGKRTSVQEKLSLDGEFERVYNDIYCRDKMINMCDAIRLASFLRSRVSSHKFHRLSDSISIADSENVRYLARILLLRRLKIPV